MQQIIDRFLLVLIGIAACDYNCFKRSCSRCQEKQRISERGTTYCQTEIAIIQCQLNASIECRTGFDSAARQALSALTDICKNGSASNSAIKNDVHCNMTTLTDSGEECNTDLKRDLKALRRYDESDVNRVICRHLNGTKDCLLRKFEKCSNATQAALKNVVETSKSLQISFCTFFKDP